MGGCKVVYLDEYRKKRLKGQKSLREMIEGHLAEAGLLEKGNAIRKSRKGTGTVACDKVWPHPETGEDAG